jgi:hypothetical protein
LSSRKCAASDMMRRRPFPSLALPPDPRSPNGNRSLSGRLTGIGGGMTHPRRRMPVFRGARPSSQGHPRCIGPMHGSAREVGFILRPPGVALLHLTSSREARHGLGRRHHRDRRRRPRVPGVAVVEKAARTRARRQPESVERLGFPPKRAWRVEESSPLMNSEASAMNNLTRFTVQVGWAQVGQGVLPAFRR